MNESAWASTIIFVAVALLVITLGSAFGQNYYRPRLRDLTTQERREYGQEKRFLREFGIRARPLGCRFEEIDLGGGHVADNLVLLCPPLFLGPRSEG